MALTSLGGILWAPAPQFVAANPSFDVSSVIDANTDRIALIAECPIALTVDQIAVSFGACSSVQNVSMRIETLTGTPATPSGTLWATNTYAPSVTPVADSVVTGTLTANATIAARTTFAVVVQGTATPINVIVNAMSAVTSPTAGEFPYASRNLTGSYANTAIMPCLAVHDATTNAWVQLNEWTLPALTLDSIAINTGTGASTGTRRGVRFSLPGPARLARVAFRLSMATGGDFDVILYNDSGTALQTMASVTAATQRASGGSNNWEIPLDPYALAASTFYKLAIVPTTATSVTLREVTVGSGMLSACPMGANFQTTAYISSAWSLITDSHPFFYLGFDQVDNGAGVGDGYLLVTG